jgi:hypothetical protein
MILDRIIAEITEKAYREGWSTGYNAGLRDGRSDGTFWCDEEGDWRESETASAMSASGQDPKGLEAKPASAVPKGDAHV